ncbi:MAG: hypothetical protein SF053_13925 [Bacteroidia bacterium]|nr:hypothetical protein [Bacteroidia bacterium]
MIESLQGVFPPLKADNCIESRTTSFGISDLSLTSPVSILEEGGMLTVTNTRQDPVFVLKIDKCLLQDGSSKGTRRCDCSVWSSDTFYWVEIKDVSTKKRRHARDEAYDQLSDTIMYFRDRMSLPSMKQRAVVAMAAENNYPAQRSKSQEQVALFEDRYQVQLLEGNEIIFE